MNHEYPWTSIPGRRGPILCHVLVAENALGHRLPKGAEVHHIDEDKQNFQNTNLVILQNRSEHAALHCRLRVKRAGGDPWRQWFCKLCQRPKDFDQFYPGGENRNACKECIRTRSRNYQRQYKRSVTHGRTSE